MPLRIQLSRQRGWRMPSNTTKVDRSMKWGNPFVIGKEYPNISGKLVLDRRHAFEF